MGKKLKIKPRFKSSDWEIMEDGGYTDWKAKYNLQETPDYNLQRAFKLGYIPDETGHLPSVDSQTGEWLKSDKHPTRGMELMESMLNPEVANKLRLIRNEEGKMQYVPKMSQGGNTRQPTQGTEEKKSQSIKYHYGENMGDFVNYDSIGVKRNIPLSERKTSLNAIKNEYPQFNKLPSSYIANENYSYDFFYDNTRPKEQPINIESAKPDLLPLPDINMFNPIPFEKGTYFSKERQSQEQSAKGKKDYFDKKTGKLLGTYKNGGYTWSTNTSQAPNQQVVNTENVNTTKTQTKEVKPSFINTLIDYNLHPKEGQNLEETLMTDAIAIAPFFKDFPGYKKLAYNMASQNHGATRNPIDIWNGSGQYDGTWKLKDDSFDKNYPYSRNLLKNYIYGDTSGFEKNNLPPIRLDRFQKKYGDIPSYDMYSNISKKDSIDIDNIFKTSELRDKLNFPIKKEFLDDLFKKNNDTIPIPFENDNPYHTTDDIAGHMGYLMRNTKNNDEINFRIQDIWKFDPDDYSKKWDIGGEQEVEVYAQARAMEAAGKPFILSRQNPVKFPKTEEVKKIKTKKQIQLENDLAGEDAFFNSIKKQKNGGKIKSSDWEIIN
jgi:hypothetical protein